MLDAELRQDAILIGLALQVVLTVANEQEMSDGFMLLLRRLAGLVDGDQLRVVRPLVPVEVPRMTGRITFVIPTLG